MIIFKQLTIKRAIMHSILAKKTELDEDAKVEYCNSLIELDNDICSIIRERLLSSFGDGGKSIKVVVSNTSEGAPFCELKDLVRVSNDNFIDISKHLADLLVIAYGNKSIPGGFFLVLDCEQQNNNPVYIVIKAERQSAINIAENNTQALKDIILSPAQKLYKAVLFEQLNQNENPTVSDFSVRLFDDQFSRTARFSDYFYRDFLGLSLDENDSVLTKQFYIFINEQIDKTYKNDIDTGNDIKEGVRSIITNQDATINPHDVILTLIPEGDRNVFIRNVVNKLPPSFSKNTQLLQSSLSRKLYTIAPQIKLTAPTELFSDKIEITEDKDDPTIKIIRVRTAQ